MTAGGPATDTRSQALHRSPCSLSPRGPAHLPPSRGRELLLLRPFPRADRTHIRSSCPSSLHIIGVDSSGCGGFHDN